MTQFLLWRRHLVSRACSPCQLRANGFLRHRTFLPRRLARTWYCDATYREEAIRAFLYSELIAAI